MALFKSTRKHDKDEQTFHRLTAFGDLLPLDDPGTPEGIVQGFGVISPRLARIGEPWLPAPVLAANARRVQASALA